ncbi:MAG TPA: TauD/TfdA family dioxygenase [Thermoanaerobaculia bacterium]|nr:TauD/TfdA family dioxygenase [Thermoanaerobaculia bacterium]
MNLRDLSSFLTGAVRENGYAFLHTGGLTDRQFLSLGKRFGELWDPNYRLFSIVYDPARDQQSNALGKRALPAHCECAYELVPPRYVLLYCDGASRDGGEFYLVSMKEIVGRLREADRTALRTTRYATLSPSTGRTTDRLLLPRVRGVGEVLTLLPIPPAGTRVSYALPVGRDRAAKRLLRRVADVAADPSLRIVHRWRRGDVAVIDNARFLHGREGFEGKTRHLWHLRVGRFRAHSPSRG